MPQRVTFKTDDDVAIVGEWNAVPTTIGAVVLVHMLPATKESWAAFQGALAQRGVASLAIDLRGHGESIQAEGRKLDYRSFTEDEHRSSMNDLRAAYEWIAGRGIDRDRIGVAGASIGANLALRLLAENPKIPAAVLVSPGGDFHGVTTDDILEDVNPHQSILILASAGDDDDSVRETERILASVSSEIKDFRRLLNAGHGTRILEGDAALMGEIADWIRDRLQD